jgi:hypothetical protein
MATIPGVHRYGATQVVAFTGTAAATANGVSTGVNTVRLFSTTLCHIRVGAAPTAVATDIPIPALVEVFMAVTPGQKISAIQDAAGGSLYVTEVS